MVAFLGASFLSSFLSAFLVAFLGASSANAFLAAAFSSASFLAASRAASSLAIFSARFSAAMVLLSFFTTMTFLPLLTSERLLESLDLWLSAQLFVMMPLVAAPSMIEIVSGSNFSASSMLLVSIAVRNFFIAVRYSLVS